VSSFLTAHQHNIGLNVDIRSYHYTLHDTLLTVKLHVINLKPD